MPAKTAPPLPNALYYGDNLAVLRDHIPDESVMLAALDPPFNSKAEYSLLFKQPDGSAAPAQVSAFEDTWVWGPDDDIEYHRLLSTASRPVKDFLQAMHGMLGPCDMLSYLTMMTGRLIELHRVLRPDGSLFLHCDPSASHYLKLLLDRIFDPRNFRNEIIWKRTSAGKASARKRLGRSHDVILAYAKSAATTWNQVKMPLDPEYVAKNYRHVDERGAFQPTSLTGAGVRHGESGEPWRGRDVTARARHWCAPTQTEDLLAPLGVDVSGMGTLDKLDALDAAGFIYWPKKPDGMPRFKRYADMDPNAGVSVTDLWTDVAPLGSQAAERLGYPTQKPVALLDRIIQIATKEGDVVIDPFCGCGTTVDAAHRLNRRWIGIDVSFLAIDVIERRLAATYGPEVVDTYRVSGIPNSVDAAQALFDEDPHEFQRWAVASVDGQPNEIRGGDQGVDGWGRFSLTPTTTGEALFSVKGGRQITPGMVRDLGGTVTQHRAELGVLISLHPPTKGMKDAAAKAGAWTHPGTGKHYPRVQIITVADIIDGKRPNLPPLNPVYPNAS